MMTEVRERERCLLATTSMMRKQGVLSSRTLFAVLASPEGKNQRKEKNKKKTMYM